MLNAPVAQLDRVPGYEPGGREFESLRARQNQLLSCSSLSSQFQRDDIVTLAGLGSLLRCVDSLAQGAHSVLSFLVCNDQVHLVLLPLAHLLAPAKRRKCGASREIESR